jgi:hypothetical protein
MKKWFYIITFGLFIILSLGVFYIYNSVLNPPFDSYYEQIIEHKSEKEYVASINQTFETIKQSEKSSALITEDFDILKYEYFIGEKDDSYQATYRFDEKGCYEVGLDTYIDNVEKANLVVNGLKNSFATNKTFKSAEEDNSLYRWESVSGLLVAELDYRNIDKGRVALTIFAYE